MCYRIENTSEGTLFFEDDDTLPIWTLRAKGWEVATLAPPFEVDPTNEDAELEKDEKVWYETHVLVGPGGAISTVSGTGTTPGTRTTARRVDGKTLRLGRETSSLDPSSSFITADGTLWNYSFYGLKRFEKGRWEGVRDLREGGPSRLIPITKTGPPWLLLDRFNSTLCQLEHGANGKDPELGQFEIQEGKKALQIRSAIPWSNGTLLLATDAGLRTYDPATEKLSKVDFDSPSKPVNALTHDGLGRLWLGGKNGLWMLDVGGKPLESFDGVPWVERDEVDSLTSDPSHDDGVIVALSSRGVVFVRAMRGLKGSRN